MSDKAKHENEAVLDKIITVLSKSEYSNEGQSKQLPPDPFSDLYSDRGLVSPPYSLDKLLLLKESNPIHGACIWQKAVDIAGLGWQWVPKVSAGKTASEEQKQRLEEFLANCNPELTFREILQAFWDDIETMAIGGIEIVENNKGTPVELHHMPGQTMRPAYDKKRICQIRNGITRWFKMTNVEENYDYKTGEPLNGKSENAANKVIYFRRVSSRSDYYGIPQYIAAIGSILGSIKARDFNIDFFSGRTIPDVLLIVSGANVSDNVQNELKAFFNAEVAGKHNKIAILPIPAALADKVKADLHVLTPEMKDASFRLYKQDNAIEICIAHQMPPYRIGWPIVGSLGGNTAMEMTKVYKQSVVAPMQDILEYRLNRQLFKQFGDSEFGENKLEWRWKLNEIDLTDRMADLDYAAKGFESSVFNRDEAREVIGKNPIGDAASKKYYIKGSMVPDEEQILDEEVIKKADKRAQRWKEFEKMHHEQEDKMQSKVADFFDYRRS